ncbi:hypothetical protein JCM11641_000552 [Rhodosporidiobolus odoratus]
MAPPRRSPGVRSRTEAAAFARAGGTAAFKPQRSGAAAESRGVGKGWGNGVVPAPQQNTAQVVVHDETTTTNTKHVVNPRRALKAAALAKEQDQQEFKLFMDGNGVVDGNGQPAGTAQTAPSTSVFRPRTTEIVGTQYGSYDPDAPPSPSSSSASAPSPPAAATASAPLPPYQTKPTTPFLTRPPPPHLAVGSTPEPRTLHADLSTASPSRPRQPIGKGPFEVYSQRAADPRDGTDFKPISNWAQGGSDFCAAHKLKAPKSNALGYAGAPPVAPLAPATISKTSAFLASPATASSRSSATAIPGVEAARAATTTGRAGTTRQPSNGTQTSKWATPAPAVAPAYQATALSAPSPPPSVAATISAGQSSPPLAPSQPSQPASPTTRLIALAVTTAPSSSVSSPSPSIATPKSPYTAGSDHPSPSQVASPHLPLAVPIVTSSASDTTVLTSAMSSAPRVRTPSTATRSRHASPAPSAGVGPSMAPGSASGSGRSRHAPTPAQSKYDKQQEAAVRRRKAVKELLEEVEAEPKLESSEEEVMADKERRSKLAAIDAKMAEIASRYSHHKEQQQRPHSGIATSALSASPVSNSRPPSRASTPRAGQRAQGTGGLKKERKTAEEIEALMAEMKKKNEEIRRKREAAEADRLAFETVAAEERKRSEELEKLVREEREKQQREEREKKERTKELQRLIDEERARSAALKLSRINGRAWDAQKLSRSSTPASQSPVRPSEERAAERAQRDEERTGTVSEVEQERVRRRDGVREEGGWETVEHHDGPGRARLTVDGE